MVPQSDDVQPGRVRWVQTSRWPRPVALWWDGVSRAVIKGARASGVIVEFKTPLSSGLCGGSHRFDVCLQGTPWPGGSAGWVVTQPPRCL